MNTIVFVLMVVIHIEPVPTIEFPTLEKCENAIKTINKSVPSKGWGIAKNEKAYCQRIEK